MHTKPKYLLSKISKEDKIRFGNNHNQVIQIIQESVLLLNYFGNSIIIGICFHYAICNPQLFMICSK